MRAIQADLFREMSASIERYEGFVEKFVGDAVMAVFGAPIAHEDDPERGLRAALLMRERVGALNLRWERRLGRPLALHIGVNTGPVVAGRIGAAADAAYAVTGDTVNTASRLQSAAPSGEILIGDTTYELTHHAFAFAPREEIPLRARASRSGSIACWARSRPRARPAGSRASGWPRPSWAASASCAGWTRPSTTCGPAAPRC